MYRQKRNTHINMLVDKVVIKATHHLMEPVRKKKESYLQETFTYSN